MIPRQSGPLLLRETQTVSAEPDGIPREDDDTLELRRLLRALWRRKLLIAATTLLTAALFFLAAMLQDRSYTAGATVMLDPREQQIIASQEQVVGDLQLNNPILESEVALLRSSTLLASAIREIGLDRFDRMDPALADPSLIARGADAAKALIRGLLPRGDGAGEDAEPLVSPELARELRIIAAVRDGLSVRRVGDSYVIEISMTTPDPVLSARVANTIAENYIEAQLADRQRVAEDATRWLSNQVENRRVELAEAEALVQSYKQDQLDQTGASEDVLQQQLVELNQQIAAARSDRVTEEARLSRILTLVEERGASAAAEALNADYLDGMRERQATLAREDARLAASLGPSHPDRQALISEIAQLDEAIAAEVRIIADQHRNEIDILSSREASLQTDMDAIEAQLSDISAASLRLRELEREADARRLGFEDMLGRLGETRAQVEIQRAEAKKVNVAQIPLGPSAPRVNLMTAFGAAIGLTAGLVLALSLELLGPGFTQVSHLERAARLPVLATIPHARVRRISSLMNHLERPGFSVLGERIRQLRMTLSLNAGSDRPLSLVVLSSVQNEGKTTTALALARSFAQAGRKTILVDLDTRRSVLLARFSDRGAADLGDWVSGRASLADTIVRVEAMDLSITGTRHSQSLLADTMSAAKIQELIDLLGRDYEVIVADAPPVLAVSDGLSIAAAVDHILYLVRYRTTSRRSLSYGLSLLKNVGLRPTGLVFTIAEIESDPEGYAQGYGST